MKYSFWMALLLASVFSVESAAGLSFTSPKRPQPKMIETVSYLSDTNTALRQALVLHNLLNEMPAFLDLKETADELGDEEDIFTDQLKFMESCYSKKYGKSFKNPQEAWAKISGAYEAKRQVRQPKSDKERMNMTSEQLQKEGRAGWYLNREVLADVYKNPQKYGELNGTGSFALWKDQKTLYDNQWNKFYEKMNAQFGENLNGRPAVSDDVRYDAKKYDQVLKAHNSYLTRLQKMKPQAFTALPPKAPEALPSVNNMVYVNNGKVYPEMPQIWQGKENQQVLAKAGGEFSQYFENGDVTRPSPESAHMNKGDLENVYDMRVALDSIQKGGSSISESMTKMHQNFLKRVADAGINVEGLDLSSKAQFTQLRQLLQKKKKEAMQDAHVYVAQLEKQDMTHPELIAQRQKQQQERRSRLSKQAKEALSELKQEIIPMSQMSPVAQQKLVLVALEKDTEALVHLTETNAMNLDQMMRERRSTNKIIAESQEKMKSVVKEQIDQKSVLQQCPF